MDLLFHLMVALGTRVAPRSTPVRWSDKYLDFIHKPYVDGDEIVALGNLHRRHTPIHFFP